MLLKFSVDTDDMYEEEMDLESLMSDSLRKEIIANCKTSLASDHFTRFAALAEESLISNIKLKLENFLSEDIAITEKWGKPKFVGSIEDLIKQQFDDILLRPVDGQGKTLQGCTSSGITWIEWKIESEMQDSLKRKLDRATDTVYKKVTENIDKKLVEIKDRALKEQVDDAFTSILKKQ